MSLLYRTAEILLRKIHSSIENRVDMRDLRVESLKELKNPMVKVAFDTRRINQYTETNPRRNLQNYHRSDPFITKDAAEKIKTLFKLKTAVDLIKESFTGDPDWHDSYCRVLSAALDRTLRLEQKDMDFAQPQFNYLEELLYLRYRLRDEDIVKLNEKELRDIILDRDERLLHKQIFAKYNNGGLQKTNELNNQTIVKGPDNLIDKLFSDVKASKDNPNVKRSVTITIDDQIVNPVQEEKKD